MKEVKYKHKIYKPLKFEGYEEFTPNVTPEQMVGLGVFGGWYFRPIYSSVLCKNIDDAHLEHGYLNSQNNTFYDINKNFYMQSCGTDLEYWEERGWIRPQDPYGWFQWYVRFYHGRRSEDDKRQILRWIRIAGPNGRFNPDRPERKGKTTRRIRQVLLHWGFFTSI